MSPRAKRPPVIILGMHRSGTTMVCQMLEELGLFVGRQKDPNNEALFFLKANDWLIQSAGGRWDYPQPIRVLLKHSVFREIIEDYLRLSVSTPRIASFLGWRNYLRYRSLYHLDIPWGWKDPRNTFTLPLWLNVFPHARVIHVLRHGVDVASSLLARHRMSEEDLARVRERYHKHRWLYNFKPMRTGFGTLNRPVLIEEGFTLWEEYVQQARTHVARLDERAMEVRFEEFLEDAPSHLEELACFSGLRVCKREVARVAAKADVRRAYAHHGQPCLRAFADAMADRLVLYGY